MDSTHQQPDGSSNHKAGAAFELAAFNYLRGLGLSLHRKFKFPVGAGGSTKLKEFDLGSQSPLILVECKKHTWTRGQKRSNPSAKMAAWNEALFYFSLIRAPAQKILFVLRHTNPRTGVSLADHYFKSYSHLIAPDVEIWEFDDTSLTHRVIKP